MKLATPVDAEQADGRRREDAAFHEARRDVAGVQQVVEFEEEAEAQQHDQLPDGARGGQAVEPRGDAAGVESAADWEPACALAAFAA